MLYAVSCSAGGNWAFAVRQVEEPASTCSGNRSLSVLYAVSCFAAGQPSWATQWAFVAGRCEESAALLANTQLLCCVLLCFRLTGRSLYVRSRNPPPSAVPSLSCSWLTHQAGSC
jgi:hypothetical protein